MRKHCEDKPQEAGRPVSTMAAGPETDVTRHVFARQGNPCQTLANSVTKALSSSMASTNAVHSPAKVIVLPDGARDISRERFEAWVAEEAA